MTVEYNLERLIRAAHRKSAMAIYSYVGFRLEVYLRHNHPCKAEWGTFFLSCYIVPKSNSSAIEPVRHVFENYADFRRFRANLMLNQ